MRLSSTKHTSSRTDRSAVPDLMNLNSRKPQRTSFASDRSFVANLSSHGSLCSHGPTDERIARPTQTSRISALCALANLGCHGSLNYLQPRGLRLSCVHRTCGVTDRSFSSDLPDHSSLPMGEPTVPRIAQTDGTELPKIGPDQIHRSGDCDGHSLVHTVLAPDEAQLVGRALR